MMGNVDRWRKEWEMKTTTTLGMVTLLSMGLLASVAAGGAPMGPPGALLGEGRWGLGAEAGYESMDLKAFGTVTESIPGEFTDSYAQLFEIKDLRTTMFFGTVAYGICDNWDVFVRAGAADARDDVVLFDPNNPRQGGDRINFDGSYGFAWGAGTRATFCRSGPWSFGGLAQVTWFRPGDSSFRLTDIAIPDEAIAGDIELDYWQTQVSLAAMYQMDTLSLWAGPFLQFVQGDLDLDADFLLDGVPIGTIKSSADLKESSQIGAHFGANWKAADRLNFWGEGQITGDSWLVSIGLVFLSEETVGL
jgi:hypothetical protein